jgi:hypothetical protein
MDMVAHPTRFASSAWVKSRDLRRFFIHGPNEARCFVSKFGSLSSEEENSLPDFQNHYTLFVWGFVYAIVWLLSFNQPPIFGTV